MSSQFEQLMAQVQVLLSGATAAGTRVHRGLADALDASELPALNIRRASSEVEPLGEGLDRATLVFDVDCEVRGDDWEAAADALHEQVHQVLAFSSVLQGMVRGLRCVSTECTAEAGDTTAGRLTARYQCQVLQRRG